MIGRVCWLVSSFVGWLVGPSVRSLTCGHWPGLAVAVAHCSGGWRAHAMSRAGNCSPGRGGALQALSTFVCFVNKDKVDE